MEIFIGIHAWGLSADFHSATPENLVSYRFDVAGRAQFPWLLSDVTTPFMSRMQALDAELLARRQTELLEKEGSGCRVLLANDRYEDLSRLYRLFSRIPDGLVPVAEIFKAHITDLGETTVHGCRFCVCCGRSVVTVAHTACAVQSVCAWYVLSGLLARGATSLFMRPCAICHSHPAVAPNCMPAVHCPAMTAYFGSAFLPLLVLSSRCSSSTLTPVLYQPSVTPPQARRRSSSARRATRTPRTRRTRRATTTRSSSRTCWPCTTSTSAW
jgi:hypothetical protein